MMFIPLRGYLLNIVRPTSLAHMGVWAMNDEIGPIATVAIGSPAVV